MWQKMQNWQNFIDCNITAVIKEKMLNWPYSIINFVKELIEKMSNWAYYIECTIYQRQSLKRYSTVQ